MASNTQRQRRRDFWIECGLGVSFFIGMIALYGLADAISRSAL